MTEQERDKEVAIKLTAYTDEFVSKVQNADKVVKGMKDDVAGIEKLAKEMSAEFKQMMNIYQRLGSQSIGSDLTAGMSSAKKELEKFIKVATKYTSRSSEMKNAAKSSPFATQGIRLTEKEIQEQERAKAELLKQENEELKEQEKLTKQILNDSDELTKATQLAARMDKARESAAREILKNKPSTADRMTRPNKSNQNEYQVPPEYEAAKVAVSEVNEEVQRNTAQIEIATNAGKRFADVYRTIRSKLNPAYAESERQVARLSARINELTRQREHLMHSTYHSAEWESLTEQISEARRAMNALDVEQRSLYIQMQDDRLFNTEEAKEAKERYVDVTNELSRQREELTKLTNARAKLNEGIGKLGTDNPEVQVLTSQIASLERQAEMTRLSRRGLLSNVRKHTRSDAKKLTAILKNTYRHIKSFFSRITHLSNSKSTERGLKRIANAFTRLWGMLRTRLKRRFISAVFEDAKSDMVQLAKAFPSMNSAISNVVNSAKALGAQLVAILQPIISTVGPLVTKVLDAATVAADKIAQFSAKLFGQNLYGKATKGSYDFVKSMDETSKSVSNANNALTDYSSNLLGFDKLNQLQAVGDDSKASISAVDTDPVQTNAFNRWAEALKELWDNKDWYGFGSKLAEGLNDAVEWINSQDWDALSSKVTGFIANIQQAFNGFIEGFNAEGVGHAIGRIGNLIIDAWNQLVKPVEEGGFDTYTLGKKIGTMFVTTLQDIKWDEAGVAFGNTGSRLVEMLRGILEQKFEDETGEHTLGYGIGKSITTFITNALKTINTDDWATLIADIVNNLLDMFIQIFSAGPDLGAKIAEILNKSLKNIEASKLGEALSGLSRTFNALIENIDWGGVVAKLGEALSHVDFWSVLKSIFFIKGGKGIGNIFGGLFGGLIGGGGSSGSTSSLLTSLQGIIQKGVSLALLATLADGMIRSSRDEAIASAKEANEKGAIITRQQKEEFLEGPDADPFERAVSGFITDMYLTIGSWLSPEVRAFKERSDLAERNGYAFTPLANPYENPWDSQDKLAALATDGQTAALTETVNNNTVAMQSMEASNNTSAQAMTEAVGQMRELFDSMSQSASDGQPVTLMVDGYKLGEIVLKQLGTLMHVRTVTA